MYSIAVELCLLESPPHHFYNVQTVAAALHQAMTKGSYGRLKLDKVMGSGVFGL